MLRGRIGVSDEDDIDPVPNPSASPAASDSIVQRLIRYGLPDETVHSKQEGLARYVREHPHELRVLATTILPSPSEVQALTPQISDDFQATMVRQGIQEQCFEAVSWLQWCAFGKDPSVALEEVKETVGGVRGVCGAVWGVNDIAYRCHTCEHDPTCAICVACFQAGDHSSHDYSMIRTNGGCCDCGDSTAWKETGFCSRHRGPGQAPPLPQSLVEILRPVLEVTLGEWNNRLNSALKASTKSRKWLQMSPEEKVAGPLSMSIVNMLLSFCNCSESMLSFTAEFVSNEELLDTLLSAEHILPKTVNTKLHELLYKLLGDPNFKYRFAQTFIRRYPKFLHDSLFDDATQGMSSRQREHSILGSFSVQIFTVPTLTPRLVIDWKLLEMLFGILKEFFLSCVGDDGRFLVSRPAVQERVYVRAVEDVRYVMSHLKVAQYIIHEFPQLCRTWLQFLAFIQGMYPQKRITNIHIEEENEDWVSAFLLEAQMANIHPLFVLGTSLVSKDGWEDSMGTKTGQTSGHEAGKEDISGAYAVVEGVELSKALIWMIAECIGVLDAWFATDRSKEAAKAAKPSKENTQVPSQRRRINLRGRLFRQERNPPEAPPLREWFNQLVDEVVDEVLEEATEMDVDNTGGNDWWMGSASASGTALSLGGGTEWPRLEFDVGKQEISFHIPLHRMLSLLLHKALEEYEAKTGVATSSSGQSNFLLRLFPEAFQVVGLPAVLMEHPLRLQVLCAQVQAGMWRRNGHTVSALCDIYRSVQWCEDSLELDLFMLQCCAAMAPAEGFVERVVSCFGLADYFTLFLWKPTEYEPVLAHELLVFLIRVISERGFCGLSPKASLRRELVQRLAIGDASHSALMNALPPRLKDNLHIQEVLETVANYRRPHGMQQGKYLLRDQSWRELDLYHPRWTPKELQSAEERYLRVCKSSAIFSQAPVWTNPFLPLQGLSRLAVSAKVHEILRALFFHGAFTPNLAESRSPESLLFTALHMLHLGLDICAKFPIAKGRHPLLALSTENVRVAGANGVHYPGEQSTLSLLVLLMRKYNASEGAQVMISETSQYNVGSFIKALLLKFAELDRQCMYAIEQLAPEILHRLSAGPSVVAEEASSKDEMQAEISDIEKKKALARERQAAMMAKMRAAQEKFLASVEPSENDARRTKQDTSRTDGKRPREDTDIDETVCALCRDRTSGSPLCVLTLVQRSRLLALSQRPVPSWDKVSKDVDETSALEEESGAAQNLVRREAENLISELRQWLEGTVADPNAERLTNRDDFFELLRGELPAMFNTGLPATATGVEASHLEADAVDEAESLHDGSANFAVDPDWWEANRGVVRDGSDNHGIIAVLAEYVAGVTQTLREARQPGVDAEAPRDNAARLRRPRQTIESKVYNSIGVNDFIGLNISACGHAAHHECVERYYASLLQRYYSRSLFEGVQIVDPDLGEFLCPVCRRLSNSIFPVYGAQPSPGVSDVGDSFRLDQACSLLYKAEEALSKPEFRESLQRKVPEPLKAVLDSLSKRLFGLFYPDKDIGLHDGRSYQGLFLWDLLRYSIMSAELASRTKSLTLGIQDSASKIVTLEESAEASRGSTLPMLLHTASLTSTQSRQALLLRARGMQLLVGSICLGVSRDLISDKNFKGHVHLHGLLQYLEKGQDSADGQFWRRVADPILVHDPFSSLVWLLFALPLQVQQYQGHLTAFVHLFYLVCVIQCLATASKTVDAPLSPQVRTFLATVHALLTGTSVFVPSSEEPPLELEEIRRLTLPYLRRCALLQTVFSSSPTPISGSNSWELSNVYSLVSSAAYREANSKAAEADVLELKEVEELERRFHLPSLERILAEETTQNLVLKWCKHLHEADSRRPPTPPRPVRARPFQLLRLPRLFQDLLQHFIKERCPRCKSVPERPALCLLCGRLCCGSGPSGCCSVQMQSECYRHAISCGGGVGAFLMLRRTNVMLLRRERQAIWPSPYLDAFGEEDHDMRRGKPLFLSEERYAALTAMVASHSLDYSTSVLSNATRDMF